MKKKILFLMPSLPSGGAEKVLIDILKHFDYKAYDVSIFLEFKEGTYLSDVPNQVEILSLHHHNNLWLQRFHRHLAKIHWYVPFHELIYRRLFLRLLKNRKFDTIVSFMEGGAVKFHSYIYNKAQRNITWVHIDLQKKHWSLGSFRNKQDEYNCYSKMDKIVFVSNDARKCFLKLYPINKSKCEVLYNLIDSEEIKRIAKSTIVKKEKFTICMIGRLNQQKRYDRAIQVAYQLKKNGYDINFWVLGEGELETKLREDILKYELENTFFLKGFIKAPYAYLKQADILLSTSESEGFSLVIAEAFCLGIPIVATRTVGPTELLDHSKYGILVDETIDSIYQGIKILLEDATILQKYALKSKERSNIFDVAEFMKNFYKLIN